MGTESWYTNLELWVSFFALTVAVLAWWTSWRTQRRIVAIEEEREKARRRPRISAKGESVESGAHLGVPRYNRFLTIENKGTVAVNNVQVLFSGSPLRQYLTSPLIDADPIAVIGPNSEFRVQITQLFPSGSVPIRINWVDDFGVEDNYESTINFS